jgi:hypothetical protein
VIDLVGHGGSVLLPVVVMPDLVALVVVMRAVALGRGVMAAALLRMRVVSGGAVAAMAMMSGRVVMGGDDMDVVMMVARAGVGGGRSGREQAEYGQRDQQSFHGSVPRLGAATGVPATSIARGVYADDRSFPL